MKAQLRNTLTAALLLAPAAALIGTPAHAAPKAAAARALEIHTLQVNADDGLRPGSDLEFALEATPRSKATVTLGRTNIVVALKETSAGMYRGTYTVRSKDRIDPTATITAKLVAGKSNATHSFSYPASFQALAMGAPAVAGQQLPPQPPVRIDRPMPRDVSPPAIADVSPRAGETVMPGAMLSGAFEDGGRRGIDPSSVRISISGRDVTEVARITPYEFSYRLDTMPPGRHLAEVSARDRAGNSVNKTWSFQIGG